MEPSSRMTSPDPVLTLEPVVVVMVTTLGSAFLATAVVSQAPVCESPFPPEQEERPPITSAAAAVRHAPRHQPIVEWSCPARGRASPPKDDVALGRQPQRQFSHAADEGCAPPLNGIGRQLHPGEALGERADDDLQL